MPTRPTANDRVRAASVRRREEHRADTQALIFRAATELLDAAGYEGFSLRKLAEAIGYTPASIYRYFRDKDELVIAVLLEGYAAFTRALRAAADRADEPFAQLDALGRAYVDFGLAHPVMYRVLFMQRADVWTRIPPSRLEEACGEDAFLILVGAVQRAIATGRTRAKDVEAASLALWALTHGVVSLCLAMPNLADPAARTKMIEGAFTLADLSLSS
jgi:AcrR family transcriptional regulator